MDATKSFHYKNLRGQIDNGEAPTPPWGVSTHHRKTAKAIFKTGLHSFRGHLATALEQVGCPEDIATKLAGHKQLSLTCNMYSKYKNKDELWQYVERIHEADCLNVITTIIG